MLERRAVSADDTHFEREESVADRRSKLEDDLVRVRDGRSYALAIAEKHRLTYAALSGRLHF